MATHILSKLRTFARAHGESPTEIREWIADNIDEIAEVTGKATIAGMFDAIPDEKLAKRIRTDTSYEKFVDASRAQRWAETIAEKYEAIGAVRWNADRLDARALINVAQGWRGMIAIRPPWGDAICIEGRHVQALKIVLRRPGLRVFVAPGRAGTPPHLCATWQTGRLRFLSKGEFFKGSVVPGMIDAILIFCEREAVAAE